jgi:hypothetical protein
MTAWVALGASGLLAVCFFALSFVAVRQAREAAG